MSSTRRDVGLVLGIGTGSALFLTFASVLFFPVLALAALGFIAVVVSAAVLLALATSRWAYVWAAGVGGAVLIAASWTYWGLWGTAFDYADSLRAVPAVVQFWSDTALISGAVAFVVLVGTAVPIRVSSGKMPTGKVGPTGALAKALDAAGIPWSKVP